MSTDSQEIIINVKGLRKSFDKRLVVNNIDLMVRKGEVFGFLGPNGSGKTTTIRMICGSIKSRCGSGYLLGLQYFDTIGTDQRTCRLYDPKI